jgi:gliding motility-associated-like protein
MKHRNTIFLTLLLMVFMPVIIRSQTYQFGANFTTGATISTCSGTFYDSGGGSASYNNNEDYTVTFSSSSAVNTHIKIYFNNFNVHNTDTLFIYDGANTTAPLISSGPNALPYFNNSNTLTLFQVEANITNTSGSITFRFKSNSANTDAGWDATISCSTPCQILYAALDTLLMAPSPNDSGYVDVCLGDPVIFSGAGVYPQNNYSYHQSDNTSLFIWNFGDGIIDTGKTIAHTYSLMRGYDVMLTVVDSTGCKSTNAINLRVRIADNPIVSVTPPPAICTGDSVMLNVRHAGNPTVKVEGFSFKQSSSQRFDSTMFIPDGPNCPTQCYFTDVVFNSFLPGQTITNANDILSVCVNMEHSFVGDLEFTIICPNNQQATLKTYINSGGAFMGAPLDGPPWDNSSFPCDPAMNTAGVGWNYCWSQSYPSIGTMNSHSSQSQLDSTNTVNNTGYYMPDQQFSNLIGCPLNGTWSIRICDYWGIDNGYIFSWDLNLSPLLLPIQWSYNVGIDTILWNGPGFTWVNDSTIYATPTTPGANTYHVEIINDFGCSYDTTITIQTKPTPFVDLGPDTTICDGMIHTFDAGNPGSSFMWSNGYTGQLMPVAIPGSYSVSVTKDGCTGVDTVVLVVAPQPVVDLGPDQCYTSAFSLDAGNPGLIYQWSTGDTSQYLNVTQSGQYSVTVTSHLSNDCNGTDDIVLRIIPEPIFSLNDAEICSHEELVVAGITNLHPEHTLSWSPGGATTIPLTISNLAPGQYTYTLTVEGCETYTGSMNLEVLDCELTIPNVFTPNADGVNDQFVIQNLEHYKNSRMIIYNRWGQRVFESDDYANNWWNGERHSDGVYFYVLLITDRVEREYSGSVTVLRNNH